MITYQEIQDLIVELDELFLFYETKDDDDNNVIAFRASNPLVAKVSSMVRRFDEQERLSLERYHAQRNAVYDRP